MESKIRYPNIHVRLVGESGEIFAVLGAVRKALKEAGVSHDEIAMFTRQARSGDYDHFLAVVMKWVEVE